MVVVLVGIIGGIGADGDDSASWSDGGGGGGSATPSPGPGAVWDSCPVVVGPYDCMAFAAAAPLRRCLLSLLLPLLPGAAKAYVNAPRRPVGGGMGWMGPGAELPRGPDGGRGRARRGVVLV